MNGPGEKSFRIPVATIVEVAKFLADTNLEAEFRARVGERKLDLSPLTPFLSAVPGSLGS